MNSSSNRWEDPIVAEVHAIREKMMAEYNFDVRAFMDDMMRRQEGSTRAFVTGETKRRRVPRRQGKKKVGAKQSIGTAAK